MPSFTVIEGGFRVAFGTGRELTLCPEEFLELQDAGGANNPPFNPDFINGMPPAHLRVRTEGIEGQVDSDSPPRFAGGASYNNSQPNTQYEPFIGCSGNDTHEGAEQFNNWMMVPQSDGVDFGPSLPLPAHHSMAEVNSQYPVHDPTFLRPIASYGQSLNRAIDAETPSDDAVFSFHIRLHLRDKPVKYIHLEKRPSGSSLDFAFSLNSFSRGIPSLYQLPPTPAHDAQQSRAPHEFHLFGDRYPRVFLNENEVFPWTQFKDWIRGIVFYTFFHQNGYCRCDNGRPFRAFRRNLAVALDDATYDSVDPEIDPFQKPSVTFEHLGRRNPSHETHLYEMIELYEAGFRLGRPRVPVLHPQATQHLISP